MSFMSCMYLCFLYTHIQHTHVYVCMCAYIRNCFGLIVYFIVLTGIDVNAHDIRFVEDNWESPVRYFFLLIRDI